LTIEGEKCAPIKFVGEQPPLRNFKEEDNGKKLGWSQTFPG
jgi:hypothetical protein